MQMYSIRYENIQRRFEASSHVAARSLGTTWLANRFGVVDADKVAVIDVDEAGYGKHTGHCQGCAPTEMCSRSGTCSWCDDRYNIATDHKINEVLRTNGVELCFPVNQVNETTWARIQAEDLDKVHEIWCRRAGDAK